jgi:hypothetical protein
MSTMARLDACEMVMTRAAARATSGIRMRFAHSAAFDQSSGK